MDPSSDPLAKEIRIAERDKLLAMRLGNERVRRESYLPFWLPAVGLLGLLLVLNGLLKTVHIWSH